MSISSVLSPAALASQVLGNSPVGAAASTAAGFINTLLQTLQQAGTVTASRSAADATATAAGTSGTAATLQAHGNHQGHRGAGPTQLGQLLQQVQARAAPTPGQLINIAA